MEGSRYTMEGRRCCKQQGAGRCERTAEQTEHTLPPSAVDSCTGRFRHLREATVSHTVLSLSIPASQLRPDRTGSGVIPLTSVSGQQVTKSQVTHSQVTNSHRSQTVTGHTAEAAAAGLRAVSHTVRGRGTVLSVHLPGRSSCRPSQHLVDPRGGRRSQTLTDHQYARELLESDALFRHNGGAVKSVL